MIDKPLEFSKIKSIAESCTAQEMFAALVWQRQFNEFDGKQVVSDLVSHCNLWSSFLFTRQIFPADNEGFSFRGLTNMLVSMANNRHQQIKKNDRGVYSCYSPYFADTLYMLTKNQDAMVTQLIDLGKKWQADSVEIYDGQNNDELSRYNSMILSRALVIPNENRQDAVLIKFWCD